MGKRKPHNFDGYGWGVLLDRWHDEGRTAHLLRGDNSPACGVRYHVATRRDVSGMHRCARCSRVEKGMIATLTVEGPGWVEVTTGGDCRALELRVPGRFALLTDGDYHVPTASTSPVTIGVYDENGEILVETTAPSLHTAKAWCERVLLDPDVDTLSR